MRGRLRYGPVVTALAPSVTAPPVIIAQGVLAQLDLTEAKARAFVTGSDYAGHPILLWVYRLDQW
jgi:hypothetical protein